MRKSVLVFCLLVLFCFACVSVEAAQLLRVGIVTGQRSVVLSSDVEYDLVDVGSDKIIQTLVAGQKYLFNADGSSLKLDNKELSEKKVKIVSKQEDSLIDVNKNLYRGDIQINLQASGNSLNVVNILPVDDYLYGSLSNYLEPLWPSEAAKAQAIVFRTIALYMMNNPTALEYDVLASSWIFYDGAKNEREDILAAVDATSGLFVVDVTSGKPIKALFHASSGGNTEEVSGVSYLSTVVDYDNDSPNYEWERMFVAKEIDVALKYAGYNSVGKLQGFEFSPFDMSKSYTDRGKSGRLKEIKVLGDHGFAIISGDTFSKIFDLPSSAFDMSVGNLLPQFVELPITDRFGNVIGVKKMPVNLQGTSEHVVFPLDRSFTIRVAWSENEKIVIRGHGDGSGIGFSQWGARGLVLDKGITFSDVIAYYYPGTVIKKSN